MTSTSFLGGIQFLNDEKDEGSLIIIKLIYIRTLKDNLMVTCDMAGGFNPFPHVGALPFPLRSALHTTHKEKGKCI